ncbi:MAG: hypothetical protein J1D88_09205 [Treponema sp.]|nr:hypothetical protein [Treponema sp.]
MNPLFRSCAILAALCCVQQGLFAFTAQDIISPVEGTWANRQPLVLDVSDGSEVYFSLTGSDPLDSGFAYDGPVIIDEEGEVSVNITAVAHDGSRSDFTVRYMVGGASVAADGEGGAFLQAVSQNPVRKYVSGSVFSIPQALQYRFGDLDGPFEYGRDLAVSGRNRLERYAPCTVTDGGGFWRFIIHTVAENPEPVPDRLLPFSISDWTLFTFTGTKLIYQIDDEYWSADSAPRELDRTVPHVVRWQSVSYEEGNAVSSCVIPPKPRLRVRKGGGGQAVFSVAGDEGYRMAPAPNRSDSGALASGLYESFELDTFFGDEVRGTLEVSLYHGNVYHGTLSAPYTVDRKAPAAPVIASTAGEAFARNQVHLKISGDKDSAIFYALSSPIESELGFAEVDSSRFDNVPMGSFVYYEGDDIVLQSRGELAAFYKVCAYALDDAGNRSAVSEYRVVVDEYNYYLSEHEPDGSVSDGTYLHPFASFSQAVEALNRMEHTRLHVYGTVHLSEEPVTIKKSCLIVGNQSRVVVPETAAIVVDGADISFDGCIFEKQVESTGSAFSSEAAKKLFVVERGSVSFFNCELVGVFAAAGVLIDCNEGSVALENTGLTVRADSYACALSALDSEVVVECSRLTSVAPTCVNASVSGGTVRFFQNACTVIGHLGRVLELSRTAAHITGNTFSATSGGAAQGQSPVWNDVDTRFYAFSGNNEHGF